jgi:hypothetical protein
MTGADKPASENQQGPDGAAYPPAAASAASCWPLQSSSERNSNMSESTNMPATAEKMKTVKAAWDKAPSGPKKDASLKHYQAAEKARSANNEAECIKELNAATSALN